MMNIIPIIPPTCRSVWYRPTGSGSRAARLRTNSGFCRGAVSVWTVTRMQTYDVHPPFYYLLLHTVCSLFPGRFSKWSGIGLNIVLFVLSWSVLAKLTRRIVTGVLRSADAPGGKAQTCVTAADVPERITRVMIFGVCLLYGFNPAVYSGVMLVRMIYASGSVDFARDLAACKKPAGEKTRVFLLSAADGGCLSRFSDALLFCCLSVFPGSGNGAVSAVGTCRSRKLGGRNGRLSHLCDCCDAERCYLP